jgi:outer membrane usher protein
VVWSGDKGGSCTVRYQLKPDLEKAEYYLLNNVAVIREKEII